MNNITEITNNETGYFDFIFKDKTEIVGAASSTVEEICELTVEAINQFKEVFPQNEDYDVDMLVSFKGQGSENELSQMKEAVSGVSGLNIVRWDVKTSCDYLGYDTEYMIKLFVRNIINHDEQLVAELLKRANNNEEYAVWRLGCAPEEYSEVRNLCPSTGEEFNTESFVFNLFVESAGSVPHLMAFAAAFYHGLVVEKDRRMAEILADCAKNAIKMYTEEEREELECWFDPQLVQYYFLGNTPADSQYVLDWIKKQANSNTIFQFQAEMLLDYYEDR